MAMPPGPSPIQTAVLQFSRDLQHAFSKAKTSLSAVATQTRGGHTGSDSVLPTPREDTLSKQSRNLDSESVISSSTLLAALDIARASSLPALPDKAEESSAQPEETEARGCESLITTGNIRRGNVRSPGQDAAYRKTHTVTPMPPAFREGESFERVNLEMGDDDGGGKQTVSSNKESYHNRSTSSSGLCQGESALPRAASPVEGDSEESVYSLEQSRLSSKRKKKPQSEHNSTTRWLQLASAAGSSASLLAPRRSSTASSSSVLSSCCSGSSPGMFERTTGRRYPYQCSPLLESASPPFLVGDSQDAPIPPYRQAAGDASSKHFRVLAGADSRQQFQRKKLSSSLACCSLGSSPCGPPLLSAALLPAPPLQQQQRAERPLPAHPDTHSENIKYNSNFKGGSYTNKCSGANPANSRLAEVENRWFFVDILGDAPRFVEETSSHEHCFSVTAAAIDSAVAGLAQPKTQRLGNSENSCIAVSREVSGSSNSVDGPSIVLLPVESGSSSSEDVSLLASTLLSDYVEDSSVSASECEQAGASGLSLSTLEKKPGEPSHRENHASATQEEELYQSHQRQQVPHELTKRQMAGQLHQGGAVGEKSTLQQFEQQHEGVQNHHRPNVQEEGSVRLISLAAERSNHLSSKGIFVQQTSADSSSSCNSITEGPTGVGDTAACSSTAASSTSSCRKQQWDQMFQLPSAQPMLQLSPRQQYRPELPQSQELQELRRHQVEGPQQVLQQQLVGCTGLRAGAALLRAAFRSSVERASDSSGIEGASIGRRRHRMQKAEGTTSFASLEAMVEFVRNSISLYGSTALEGVTFHVPAEDAESLVAALEETLPYSWRDLRSAALEALKPLTALMLGRFVLVQLPSLLLELAGGAAAENAAAAAATAVAEASGFSAVLAVAPWLIVFGGCVYAIIRGAQALQASRRAQFIIYEEGNAVASLLRQQQQQPGGATLSDACAAVIAEAAAASPEPSTMTRATAVATPPATADRNSGAPSPTTATVVVQPLAAESPHSGAGAVHPATAPEASESAGTEAVGAAREERRRSDISEGSAGDEKHPLLQRSAAEEHDRTKETAVVGRRRSTSSIRRSSSGSKGNTRRWSTSRSSGSIVDLLGVAGSRRNGEGRTDETAILDQTQECNAENIYAKGNDVVRSCGSDLRSDSSGASRNGDRMRNRSNCTRLHRNSRNDTFCGSSVESYIRREVTHLQSDTECSAGAATDSVVAEPPATAARLEELATVFQDPRRRSQEEEALRQQLLTCSADWREKNFSFDV